MSLYFLFFFVIVVSIYIGGHLYLYKSITSGVEISRHRRTYIKISFLIASLSFLIAKLLVKYPLPSYFTPFIYVCTLWGGVFLIGVCVFLLRDILRILFRGESFKKNSTVIAIILLCAASIYSTFNGARVPVLKEVILRFEKLPERLSGFTIIQLSDIHLNRLKTDGWLRKIVAVVNAQNADLITITGDLVDTELCKTNKFSEILKELKAKHGVYAVTGNHEYYIGIEKFMEFTRKSNITVLRNTKITIDNSIVLIGVDDDEFRRSSKGNLNLSDIIKNTSPDKLHILLSHRPTNFEEAAEMGVDLLLSGHTHAGQIFPAYLITKIAYKYSSGLYRYNKSYIYTSAGAGTGGVPMRLFSRSEIIKIVFYPD